MSALKGVRYIACEQALHLVDIVKRERATGTREETRKRGRPLAQLGELVRRLSGIVLA